MYLRRKSTMMLATALLGGCSGEVGMPEAVDPIGGSPPAGVGESNDSAEPTTVVNPDGSMTITNPDGSTTTVDESGEVIATTPPAEDVAGDGPGAPDDGTPGAAPTPTPASSCEPGTPQSTQVPRLTNRQYDNTIADLIGLDLQLSATTLQADSKGNMDARTWGSYQTAAASVAATVISDTTARAAVVSCTTEDAACAQQVIEDFGAKVFRRPLTPEEVSRYHALFTDTTLTASGTFDEQLQVVLEALFQSPYFITIAQISETPSTDVNGGTRYALNDYELASRLSYMLWDRMPDQPLLDAAAAGTLTQGDGLAEQAARMLQDERAKGLVDRLHMNYLRMGDNTRWVGYTRDGDKYPTYNPAQIGAIAEETIKVAESVVFSGGSFEQLMTTTVGFVNTDTAPLYGLDASQFGAELTQTDLGAGRPGILTRAGFLAANSYGNRTSPIHRGAFIIKDVLCTPMGNPSPDAASTPLPDDPSLVTNRQKTEAQTSIAPDCVGCHESIVNPPGFALESFDAVGGIQTTDNGAPIDTEADVLVGSQVVHVTGPEDLMTAIAAAPEAKRCYTENWVQVAYNRVLSAEDVCTVDQIAQKMADADYAVANLITDLATVESFRYRAHETEVSE